MEKTMLFFMEKRGAFDEKKQWFSMKKRRFLMKNRLVFDEKAVLFDEKATSQHALFWNSHNGIFQAQSLFGGP